MQATFTNYRPRYQPQQRRWPSRYYVLFILALGVVGLGIPGLDLPTIATVAADEAVSFTREVRPILADKCFHCHGPDAGTRKAELRLDVASGALGGKTPVIVPGKPDQSELLRRINAHDGDEIMPPPAAKKSLTTSQKEILRQWIAQGANYQTHWAFTPVSAPAIPALPAAVASKPVAPIDAFLLARLQIAKLAHQPEADRETLIRRVAFALTGLPPTVPQIDEYLADNAPNAYERMVERFLASPRYGEEMARHWLDVARYADTHGLHLDNERQMWAYRDWVVQAFNENLSFDQFTLWQVAGDLLPNPTPSQLVATGFNRCNVSTSEGGSIDSEFVYRYAVERTTAVSQAWLGLTAGCAVCHDHKYDPLTMKEFYGLYAFFNSAADPAMDGNINTTPPFYKAPNERQKLAQEAAQRVEREARAWLDVMAAQTNYVDPTTVKTTARRPIRQTLLDEALPPGTTSRSSTRNGVDWHSDPAFGAASGQRVLRQKYAVGYNDHFDFLLCPILVPHEASVEVSIYFEPTNTPRTITLALSGGRGVSWNKVEGGMRRAGSNDPLLVPGKWNKVVLSAQDTGLKPGTRVQNLTLSQDGGIVYWDGISLVGQTDPAQDPLESFTVWRKTLGGNVPPEMPGELHGILRADLTKPLPPADEKKLREFYLAVVARPATPALAAARQAWEAARDAYAATEDNVAGTFIFREMTQPRPSFVMVRGQYDKPGEPVEPTVPAVLPAIAKPDPKNRLNRLDLAKWLVAPEHPLTARVTVNRLWQQFFGTGLVKTSYDFGAQGESPSHPELLDWLARDFQQSGWNVKRFVKQLLMSDAFRRRAVITPEVLAADPGNRLYARGPRFRLDAEQVRDNALYVSGLIDLTMGGRGVNPYQPPNIWEPVGYADSNTRFYLQDHGSSLYRRSLYVFLKRTAPPPFMSNFDAPNREQVCTVRERSNTPLQALQLMNDVQHFEAARALAEKTIPSAPSDNERIVWLYRVLLARRPDADESRLVLAQLTKQRELFRADPQASAQVARVGESAPKNVAPDPEIAAWAMICNMLLNTDETLCRN